MRNKLIALVLLLCFAIPVLAGSYPDALRQAWAKDNKAFVSLLNRGVGVPVTNDLMKAKVLLFEADHLLAGLTGTAQYRSEIADCRAKIDRNASYCNWWLEKFRKDSEKKGVTITATK